MAARLPLTLKRFAADRGGATAVEYGLIVACLCLGALVALGAFGDRSVAMYNYIGDTITGALTKAS